MTLNNYAAESKLKEVFGEEEPCCYSGNYPTSKLRCYETHQEGLEGLKTAEVLNCDICYSTFSSNARNYPSQYPERKVMHQVSYCTNLILDSLKNKDLL